MPEFTPATPEPESFTEPPNPEAALQSAPQSAPLAEAIPEANQRIASEHGQTSGYQQAPAQYGQPQMYQQPPQQYGQAPSYQAPAMQSMGVLAQMGGQGVAVASGRLLKKRSPVMTWLVFPLITLGIYQLVWYYKIHKEMAEFDRRREVPVTGPMLVMLLLSWTGIALLISYYNTGQRIQNAQRAAGLAPTSSPVIACLLAFVFGLSTFYMQSELNKIVDHYGGAPEGAVVPLYV